jgi:DNA-binding transcriptional ArsR family regulator
VTQPTVSHHLKILNAAGLLNRRKEGTQVYCTLDQDRVYECCGMLMGRFAPEVVSVASIEVDVVE